MSRKRQEIRCYDYVNRPYEDVRRKMTEDAIEVFRSATKSAADRGEAVAAGLRVNIAGIQFGKDVAIEIKGLNRIDTANRLKTTIALDWQATETPRLFPVMNAELSVYPISANETQLDFLGSYDPPLGMLGKAIDLVVGHRIAEACVHQFVTEIAEYLRQRPA